MIEETDAAKTESFKSPESNQLETQEPVVEAQLSPFFKRALKKAKDSPSKPPEIISRNFASKAMTEATLPTEKELGYKSKVGMFGGKLVWEGDKLIFNMKGSLSKVDKWGDSLLRTYDEHTVKEPLKMLRGHPRQAMRAARQFQPKRYRGSVQEIRRSSGDTKMIDKAMLSVLEGYQDPTVIRAAKSLALRGRLTLPGDASSINLPPSITRKLRSVFSVHNQARLGVNAQNSTTLRDEIVKNTTNFLGILEPKTA